MDAPDDFSHPYTPYPIQQDLMKHVYTAVEAGKVAIVESPTGTVNTFNKKRNFEHVKGKSLSLICANMTWIHDNEARQTKVHTDALKERLRLEMADEPSWLIERETERQIKEMGQVTADLESRMQAIREREAESKSRARHQRKRQKVEHTDNEKNHDSDSDFAPEDATEDFQADEDGISPEVRNMMKRIYGKDTADPESDEPDVIKIIFASRTHSQLSQFMTEVKKTRFNSSRTIALSGRSNLCINDEVKISATSNEDLNEKCLDLQKKDKQRCPFLPPPDDATKLNDFRDRALASVHTVEDLEDLGRSHKTCPYYGSRKAIKQARLVAVPYQLVLQEASRTALGLSLKDNVIVIDEAHALIDTILNSRTVSIDSPMVTLALQCLKGYRDRFRNVLKGINAVYLSQFIALLSRFSAFSEKWMAEKSTNQKNTQTELILVNELALKLNLDALPIRSLDSWIKDSKIARKASGYSTKLAEKAAVKQNTKATRTATTSTIYRIQSFFMCLAEPDKDGRILLDAADNKFTAKYLLLNPEDTFKEIVQESRAVVLAGGTMAPMSDFQRQLFSYASPGDISILSCGHVIPQSNVLARTLSVGPTGKKLEFKFDQRNDQSILDELGQSLFGITNVVSGGVVCFFPSYAFLDNVLARWRVNGLIGRLEKKRKIFTEPKLAVESAGVLKSYSDAVESGAILLAVIGAKLSEGINFSDALCRCVIVVSIPFPSTQSIELKERMKYVSSLGTAGSDQGKLLYSTLAFRAVNQAIGPFLLVFYTTLEYIDRPLDQARSRLVGYCVFAVKMRKFR